MRGMLLLAGISIAVPALAAPTSVTPFDIALPGTSAAAEPGLAGAVVSDTLVPFSVASTTAPANGTVQVRTVRGADGKLSFYWKINNAAASKGQVSAVYISGFPKAVYDANWRKDGLGSVAPTKVQGGFSFDFKSWLYGFAFATAIKPGESSRFFFLRSNAVAAVPSTARISTGGGVSADFAVLAPAS